MSYYMRRVPDPTQRYPDRSWECYLCGDRFDSEVSKDTHMTRCMVADMDGLDRSSDEISIRAVRFPESPPAWGDRPPNPANIPFSAGPDDFSAAVGSKRDTDQPQLADPQGFVSTQYIPDPMRRHIQYPPTSGAPYKSPGTNPPIASYLTEGPKNPLFQNSNITSNIPKMRYQPQYVSPPVPPVLYTRTPPQYAAQAQTSQQTFKTRPSEPIAPWDARQKSSPPNATLDVRPNEVRYNVREVPSASEAPATQQRAVYPHNEPSPLKLLSTRLSEDASVHPAQPAPVPVSGLRRADQLEVKLVWEKQQPTLETELEYFDEKGGRITFSWDRRKEVFLGSARLAPGEHSGTLLIPDRDKVFSTQPFNVSPYSVGIQEIKVDLIDIAVKSKLSNPASPDQDYSGLGKDPARREAFYKEKIQEPQVLQSQHRPLFQPPQTRAQEGRVETRTDKSSTFLVNPPREPPVERRQHTPPFQSLPLSSAKDEPLPFQKNEPLPFQKNEPLPFQTNMPGEKPKDPSPQHAQPQEERRVEADPHPYLPRPINLPRNQTENGSEALARALEREMKLQNEVGEWEGRFRRLKESNEFAENENNVLKREVEQFKVKFIDAMTKLENRSAQRDRLASAREVEDLKSSLVQAKEQMEALRRETEAIMQQSDAHEQKRARLDQEKLKYTQAERESYKKAAYRYREEREKTKSSLEEMTRAYGEYKQKYTDVLSKFKLLEEHSLGKLKQREEHLKTLEDKNRQLESELNILRKMQRQNSNELGRTAQRETEISKLNLNFQPVRALHEDTGSPSLGSIRSDSSIPDEKRIQKKSHVHKDQTPDERVTNPYISLPLSINSKVTPTTETVTSPSTSKRKQSAVLDRVLKLEQGEESKPATPRATPRAFKAVPTAKAEELERYTPEVLTVFQNKTSPLFYKGSPVKSINLAYLKKPESHRHKQVLVKVKEAFWLGYLQTVFSKKHPYLSKSEMFAGVRLLEPVGNSSGTYESVRYFDCEPNHAIFISLSEVYVPVL